MKNNLLPTLRGRASRALTGISAPTGPVIVAGYLVGMTAIAAGAYAMRDQLFSPPALGTDIAAGLPQPSADPGLTPSPGFDTRISRRHGANAPALAALDPSDVTLRENLVSPLSRIFFGAPSAVPPRRPLFTPGAQKTDGRDEAARTVSLRPRIRPDTLDIGPGNTNEETLRLASLTSAPASAPGETEQTLAATPPVVPRAHGTVTDTCPRRLARGIPRRSRGAPGAKTVLASVQKVDGVKRDQLVLREVLRGNMPGFMRSLVPVGVSGRTSDGRDVRITLCVTPDYLALGSDRDYVRVPLGLRAATRIGEEFGMILPTPRMVDLIYRAASLRLPPRPMDPGPQMTSTAYFTRHNATVEAQRASAGAVPGTLISGHKKDVVLSTRLASNRGRVAIYGWHRKNGRPIQPLSTVHGAGYADYSHGVRLVSRTAFLDGEAVDLRRLMADPRYSALLSKEGPVGGPRLRMAALAAN